MNISTFQRLTTSALITSALLVATPASAATPKTVKPKPPVLTCNTSTPEGLSYTVIKPGKGGMPPGNAKVKVNYQGFLSSDGTKFDSGEGAQFGVGGVIPGFSQGLKMMQAGAKYRLCIPSKLGYGEAGTGPIPPNADLVFEVELLSFTSPPPKPVIPLTERTCDQTTATGLGFAVIKQGNGKLPTDADVALVDFTTFDAKTGVVGDRREWETIPLSQATTVFGEALKKMAVGSSYTFCVPVPKPDAAAPPLPEVNIRVDLLDVRAAPSVD